MTNFYTEQHRVVRMSNRAADDGVTDAESAFKTLGTDLVDRSHRPEDEP
jgi:hypothetical protein